MQARDLDDVARRLLSGLAELPGVARVGLALSEGAGRRLRFTTTDTVTDEDVTWCHIDAYEDVPLTTVVRTGDAIIAGRSGMDRRYQEFVAGQPDEVQGFAVVPLPSPGSPIGGLIVFLEHAWQPRGSGRRLLDSVARHAADAVRRVRGQGSGQVADAFAGAADVAERAARLVLPDDPRSVGRARRFLRDFFATAVVPADIFDTAELCLSELATNALLHSDGTFELRVTFDDRLLTVAVRDRGQREPATVNEATSVDDDLLVVFGRGLQLVEALVDRWGSERDGLGFIVWFVLDLESASSEAVG